MFELQQFVHECRAALEDARPTQSIEALVKAAICAPTELRDAFAKAEGVERQGPITFACRDTTLSVADVTIPPGLRSPAHDHMMWAVIGVYDGQEHNRFYRVANGGLQEQGERLLKQGDVVVLGSAVIHAIANPLPASSSAIHVYGGDLVERQARSLWNPHTHEREDFEMTRLMTYVNELSETP